MDIFSIDLSHNEIAFVRHALDLVTVTGKDAKFLSSLQIKLESELSDIERMKQEAQAIKEAQLHEIVELENQKVAKKKS